MSSKQQTSTIKKSLQLENIHEDSSVLKLHINIHEKFELNKYNAFVCTPELFQFILK
jgi:hypothetical protein